MAYLHIDNLYKNKDILLFKECYALEKIHGTSAHVVFHFFTDVKPTFEYDAELNGRYCKVGFFAGGSKYEDFVKLFDAPALARNFLNLGLDTTITVYGEAYGGKVQGMSNTYGKTLQFVAFDVSIGETWTNVAKANFIVEHLGLPFVHYEIVPTNIEILDKLSEADSVQAIRNGMGEGKIREGIVLRPLMEFRNRHNARIIAKHKNEKFQERMKQPKVKVSVDKLEVLAKADAIAEEWVTDMRLSHVLDKFGTLALELVPDIIKAMIEDIEREAKGEIIESKDARRAIGKRTVMLIKNKLKQNLTSKSE